ncbi:MAG: hypothetical protein H6719_38200, partial [Sandaracinaceae bacterium]|nr:hypothetical protein [Sandaracinaceae bacterium]
MSAATDTYVLGYAGMFLFVIGTTVAIAMMAFDPQSALRKNYARYCSAIDKELRFLLIKRTGPEVARMQVGACLVTPVLAFFLEEWILLLLIPPIALAPYVILRQRRAERVEKIEAQLDSWLM